MIRWTLVPLRALALGVDVEPGDQVPGRIVAMDLYRREGHVDGMSVGTAVDAIEWSGLGEAAAWLDQQDVLAPEP